MDIKLEPLDDDYDGVKPRQHDNWFELPIQQQDFENDPVNVNNIKTEAIFEHAYIKQEIPEYTHGATCEKPNDHDRHKVPSVNTDIKIEFIPQIKQEFPENIDKPSHSINECSKQKPITRETKCLAVSSDSLIFNASERDKTLKVVDFIINHQDVKRETVDVVAVVKLIKIVFYDRNFVCEECYQVFPFRNSLLLHKDVHNGFESGVLKGRINDTEEICVSKTQGVVREKKFKCSECDYRCLQSATLKRHYMVHSGEKPFKCDDCNYKCRSYTHLKVHRMIHTGEKPFQCTQCSFKCRTPSDMKMHSKTHSGEKPFQCEQCDYKCVTSKTLKRHMTLHTGEKPLKCAECEFRCRTPYHMKVHLNVHTGANPFKCMECNYECVHANTLKIHMMIHSGDRPFQCVGCDYKARTSYRLKMHMKVHLGDKTTSR